MNGRIKDKISVFYQVESIELPMDNKTNKRRGFCFITFKEEEPVKKIMEKKYHNVGLSKVGGVLPRETEQDNSLKVPISIISHM